jgi:hypothetical protein
MKPFIARLLLGMTIVAAGGTLVAARNDLAGLCLDALGVLWMWSTVQQLDLD